MNLLLLSFAISSLENGNFDPDEFESEIRSRCNGIEDFRSEWIDHVGEWVASRNDVHDEFEYEEYDTKKFKEFIEQQGGEKDMETFIRYQLHLVEEGHSEELAYGYLPQHHIGELK